jgi:hypothetical protein
MDTQIDCSVQNQVLRQEKSKEACSSKPQKYSNWCSDQSIPFLPSNLVKDVLELSSPQSLTWFFYGSLDGPHHSHYEYEATEASGVILSRARSRPSLLGSRPGRLNYLHGQLLQETMLATGYFSYPKSSWKWPRQGLEKDNHVSELTRVAATWSFLCILNM